MLEDLIIMLIFTLPFISFAVYKKRFRALILAGIMGLVIDVPLGYYFRLLFPYMVLE